MKAIVRNYKPGKRITLYDSRKDKNFLGTMYFKKSYEKSKKFFQFAALFCLAVSIFSLINIFTPVALSALHSSGFLNNPSEVQASNNAFTFGDVIKSYQQKKEGPVVVKEFVLSVPKIGLESPVAPNVDLSNESVYKQKLSEDGVAHALGSYYPGQGGTVFLFAHSTDTVFNIARFNAKFFALKDLTVGDEIDLQFNGKKFTYKVSGREIIDPGDIEAVRKLGSSLILMTCTPPGTDWQRLIVSAELVQGK